MLGPSDLKEFIFLPALVGWFAVRGERPAWARWMAGQVALAAAVELSGKLTMAFGVNNHALYNSYMVGEYALLSLVLWHMPPTDRLGRRLVLVGAAMFFLAFTLDLFIRGTYFSFASNALIAGGTLLAVQAALALWRLMLATDLPLYGLPAFWVLVSTVLYFFCFLPVLGLYNYLTTISSPLADQVYGINDVLFILRYGMIAVGFWLLRSRQAKA